MKARMPAGFGRPDMNALMRQAQKMQDDMKAKQAELEAAEYTGSASGEMVTVRMNGKHEILGITIKPEAVDPEDVEMLGLTDYFSTPDGVAAIEWSANVKSLLPRHTRTVTITCGQGGECDNMRKITIDD